MCVRAHWSFPPTTLWDLGIKLMSPGLAALYLLIHSLAQAWILIQIVYVWLLVHPRLCNSVIYKPLFSVANLYYHYYPLQKTIWERNKRLSVRAEGWGMVSSSSILFIIIAMSLTVSELQTKDTWFPQVHWVTHLLPFGGIFWGAFGSWLGHEGKLMSRINAVLKETSGNCLTPSTMRSQGECTIGEA